MLLQLLGRQLHPIDEENQRNSAVQNGVFRADDPAVSSNILKIVALALAIRRLHAREKRRLTWEEVCKQRRDPETKNQPVVEAELGNRLDPLERSIAAALLAGGGNISRLRHFLEYYGRGIICLT